MSFINSSFKNIYGFITLEYIHSHLSSEFSGIESEFRLLQRNISHYDQANNYSIRTNEDSLEKLIIKFQGINSRSNVQNVKDCAVCCMCFN